jgi:hypothetical protein
MARQRTIKKKAPVLPVRQASDKRALKTPEYKSFRLSKRIKHPSAKLPSGWRMLKSSVAVLWRNKLLFGPVIGIFTLLYIVFVRGFAGSDLTIIKEALNESNELPGAQASTAFGLVAYLLGNTTSGQSEIASLYQLILAVVFVMAMIWGLRQVQADKPVVPLAREAYYKGPSQFVPFMLVLSVVGLQFVPALVGSTIYQQVMVTGISATSGESLVWLLLLLASLLLTFYMLCSSLFALIIVTLPGIVPMQALRSARELVRYRRGEVMRKVVFAPVALALFGLIILLPIVLFLTAIAEFIFFGYGVLCLTIMISYLYQLYRNLMR